MRTLDQAEMEHLLRTQPTAFLAVLDGDTPYVTPLSFVYSEGEVVFRTKEGRRLDALRRNPRVGVSVAATGPGSSEWSTVFIAGTASIISGRDLTGRYAGQIVAKYRAAYGTQVPDWMGDDDACVVKVTCEEMTGRAAGETRPGRFES